MIAWMSRHRKKRLNKYSSNYPKCVAPPVKTVMAMPRPTRFTAELFKKLNAMFEQSPSRKDGNRLGIRKRKQLAGIPAF